jgi:hypothetical protein
MESNIDETEFLRAIVPHSGCMEQRIKLRKTFRLYMNEDEMVGFIIGGMSSHEKRTWKSITKPILESANHGIGLAFRMVFGLTEEENPYVDHHDLDRCAEAVSLNVMLKIWNVLNNNALPKGSTSWGG